MISNKLREITKNEFQLSLKGIHGESHWRAVNNLGQKIADHTEADRTVVELFSIIHDSKRMNNGRDPNHGRRAAKYVENLIHLKLLDLTKKQIKQLITACKFHSDGWTSYPGADDTVYTCWDADRLDLNRAGLKINPRLLCTNRAKDPEMLKWAKEESLR